MDERGGEQYLIAKRQYELDRPEWDSQYKAIWIVYCRYKNAAQHVSSFGSVALIPIIAFFFGAWKFALLSLWVVVPLFAVIALVSRFLDRRAAMLKCPGPPVPPNIPSRFTLFSKLDIIYDSCIDRDDNPGFVTFSGGYPPDWEGRKAKCLRRDLHECRLCGAKAPLHVHHVKPVSFGGTHSLQNLITLCKSCHMRSEYFEHRRLITENIRAKKKHYVKPFVRRDGVKVEGHYRRHGRRGAFWRKVHQSHDHE